MGSMTISWIVFACIFGGVLIGMLLRTVLPEHHLSPESKDVVKLGMGLIATMTALILGLLVSSTKGSYDTQGSEITEMSAKVVLLDRVLAHYGPETNEARGLLRSIVVQFLDQTWSGNSARPPHMEPTAAGGDTLYDNIQALAPQNDAQRSLKAQALSIGIALGHTRMLLFAQSGSSISTPFLVVVVFWLTIIFLSFGLHAPPNATVITALFLCALSVSGAIFLILELDRPFSGVIQISSAPLVNSLAQLGR
jgi:hypothetical protein